MVNKKKGDAKELRDNAKKKKSDDQNKGVLLTKVICINICDNCFSHGTFVSARISIAVREFLKT